MPLPNVPYANDLELDTPALDQTFNALGNLGTIPCTATGQNTIALTPVANTPAITSYGQFAGVGAPIFTFTQATTTNSSPVTVNVLGLGAKNLYKNNGAALAGSGDLVTGNLYMVSYNPALNSSAGGFVLVNQAASGAAAGSVQGTSKNGVMTTNSNTVINYTADAIAVSDGAGNFTTLLSVNVSPDASTTGANGLDTGALAASTWYYVFVIYNPASVTVAGLISLSATSPTLPAGYTQFARVGSDTTDGSSHFQRVKGYGRQFQYVLGTNPANSPNIANGSVGAFSATSPTLVAATVTGNGFTVPATASRVYVVANNKYKAGTLANVMVAPNTSWGGANNGPAGSNGNTYPIFLNAATNSISMAAWLLLETATIAWLSDAAGGEISCLGWEDSL